MRTKRGIKWILIALGILLIAIIILFYKIFATDGTKEGVIESTTDLLEEKEDNLNVLDNMITEEMSIEIVPQKTYQGYEMVATLKVPSIDIEYPVLAENTDELMEITLNKFWGCNPNEVGNFCVIGHNYKSGKHFGKLKNVKVGDKVLVTDNLERTLTYEVYDTFVVDPYNTKCTSQLTDGRKEVTLITCTNAGKDRLIVKAREI